MEQSVKRLISYILPCSEILKNCMLSFYMICISNWWLLKYFMLQSLFPMCGCNKPFHMQSTRPVSTKIPSSSFVLRGVKPWIMVKNGSVEASQSLQLWAISVQFHGFYFTLGSGFQKLELQKLPLSPLRLPSGQTPGLWSCPTPGIESQTPLVKSQCLTTELSWQPFKLGFCQQRAYLKLVMVFVNGFTSYCKNKPWHHQLHLLWFI